MKAINMNFEGLKYTTYTKTKSDVQVSYLGNTAHSTKLMHSQIALNISTYGVYLAPSNLSGFNVCQNSASCREHCLFGSGQTMMSIMSGKMTAVEARIKKTRLLKQNKDYFMQMLISEIKRDKLKAEKNGRKFSVRLNCTSDVNVEEFTFNGVNICDIFPGVQFYDYTKVFSHIENAKKYSNYDVTFSYSGSNWKQCEQALNKGVRVAVVFENKLPKKFHSYEVIDGDLYDARYFDEKNVIVGLKFKRVASAMHGDKGAMHFQMPKTPFIVQPINVYSEW